ncbi:MAG: hypothetical protein IKU05_05510 [Bacteroidales bacterium]|nr:hypothetical protein [Bacteroidales bacterium]MBR6438061.1 hypothetical protein [Bacteroidales bacterium]
MSLDTLPIESNLDNGFVTQGLIKNGSKGTFLAIFKDITGEATALLEQSPDGESWSEIEESELTITEGQTEQMWVENIMPRGTMLRLKLTQTTGVLVAIKLLSNE